MNKDHFVPVENIRHMEIALGNQCNQHCLFCYQEDRSSSRMLKREIWNEWLLPVYETLDSIVIIGGEPTIMANAYELVSLLHDQFPHVGLKMITNGRCFDHFWQGVFLERGRKIMFSLNAASAGMYERITRGGNWNEVVDNLSRLLVRRRELGSRLQVHASFVITKENYEETPSFIRLAAELGVDRCAFNVDFVRGVRGLEEKVISSIQVALADALIYPQMEVLGLQETLALLGGNPALEKIISHDDDYFSPVCKAPWSSLDVRVDGTVFFCNAIWLPLGNVRDGGVRDLWNSANAQKIRSLISKGRYSACKNVCTMNVNARTKRGKLPSLPYAAQRYASLFMNNPTQTLSKVLKRVRAKIG